MTISTTEARKLYTGNGSTTSFAVSFDFDNDADLKVELITTSTNDVTLQVLNTDYTVSGTNVTGRCLSTVHSSVLAYADPNDRNAGRAQLPFIVYSTTAGHTEIRGELRGVVQFSGVDLDNKDWVTISGTDYKFFIRRYSDSVCEGYGPVHISV